MKFMFFLLALTGVTYCSPSIKVMSAWTEYKNFHGKQYKNLEEENRRLGIFIESKKLVEEHNARFANGTTSYTLALNKFADMSTEEVNKMLNGYKMRSKKDRSSGSSFRAPTGVKIPDSFDWRSYGAVTPVKNQQQCGSCWTFSTTGALEGQMFLKTGNLVSLSEQNIVDCAGDFGNEGCNGGFMEGANQYIIDNNGIAPEDVYPYAGVDMPCRYDSNTRAANVKGFVDTPYADEDALKAAVATIGPISVSIDASRRSFHLYSGGIYYEPACDPWNLDHAVLAVGYGIQDGQTYWEVKNSWGTDWGEEGYVKMIRNKNNNCGIASETTYPLV